MSSVAFFAQRGPAVAGFPFASALTRDLIQDSAACWGHVESRVASRGCGAAGNCFATAEGDEKLCWHTGHIEMNTNLVCNNMHVLKLRCSLLWWHKVAGDKAAFNLVSGGWQGLQQQRSPKTHNLSTAVDFWTGQLVPPAFLTLLDRERGDRVSSRYGWFSPFLLVTLSPNFSGIYTTWWQIPLHKP